MNYLERAEQILNGKDNHTHYKKLTLKQIRSWKKWRDPGKERGEPWNHGEIMLAFEDGAVSFEQGGGQMQKELNSISTLAEWIRFLDGFNAEWH